MKKYLLFFLIFIISSIKVYNQNNTGLGIGSRGVSFKFFSSNTISTTIRSGIGAGYSIESFDFSLTPEVISNLNFIRQENMKLYGGLGLKGFTRFNIKENDDIYNFTLYFFLPIGVECQPFKDYQNIAFGIESQLNFTRSGTINPEVYGLFEILYYFNP